MNSLLTVFTVPRRVSFLPRPWCVNASILTARVVSRGYGPQRCVFLLGSSADVKFRGSLARHLRIWL